MESLTTQKINTPTPNEGQQRAIDGLLEWLNIPDAQRKEPLDWAAGLSGGAGTGKTFTIKYVLDKANVSKYKIVVSAPTHKAKKVVVNSTNLNGDTIHSLLALAPNMDTELFDVNNPEFKSGKAPKLQDYRGGILALDEASMLNSDLFDLVIKTCQQYRVRVIFIGDHRQIPPVRETESKAMSIPNIFKLDKVVRQADTNPLAELLQLIIDDIDTYDALYAPTFNEIYEEKKAFINHTMAKKIAAEETNKKLSGSFTSTFLTRLYDTRKPIEAMNEEGGFELINNAEEFVDRCMKFMTLEESRKSNIYCKYIAWTNTNLTIVNRKIRGALIDSTDLITVGDVLMAYNTLSVKDPVFGDLVPVITNSEDYLVTECERYVDAKDFDGQILEQKYFKVRLKNLDNDAIPTTECYILVSDWETYANCIYDVPDFYKEFKPLHYKATNFGYSDKSHWARYGKFKNVRLTLCKLNETNDENSKLVLKKDIDYGHGISVHKSQGGTYNNVFVNLKNINMNPNMKEKLRLIYVAISRAKERCFIYR